MERIVILVDEQTKREITERAAEEGRPVTFIGGQLFKQWLKNIVHIPKKAVKK